jgi:hypothetical protein
MNLTIKKGERQALHLDCKKVIITIEEAPQYFLLFYSFYNSILSSLLDKNIHIQNDTMRPQFDLLGYLKPYDLVDFTFDEFRYYFVEKYPNSVTRKDIFEKYLRYLNDFQNMVTTDFIQWIGGSFVTDVVNPNDIDFITIVNHRTVASKNQVIRAQFEGEIGFKNYDVDAYFIRTYPYGHDKFWIYEKDTVIWRNDFGTDRDNLPKGIVQLKFN